MPARLTLRDVNNLNCREFVAVFGSLFERSPWVAEQAWSSRPFQRPDELQQALNAALQRAPLEQKLALIRAHPEIGRGTAAQGSLTPESKSEQSRAGLDQLPGLERDTMLRLNRTYREKFGFPFVICVREHSREGILANASSRLEHTREEEIQTALAEIAKIAHLRLLDVVEWDDRDR